MSRTRQRNPKGTFEDEHDTGHAKSCLTVSCFKESNWR